MKDVNDPLAGTTIVAQRESNFGAEHQMLCEAVATNGKFIDDPIQKIGPILSPEQPLLAGTENKPTEVEQPLAPVADAIRELRQAVARVIIYLTQTGARDETCTRRDRA